MQNALNHTQYINISNSLNRTDFGRVGGTRMARVIQIQLRLAF